MIKKLSTELEQKLFPDNTLLMAYRGSIAHNMYIPDTDPNSTDDIDLMGVYMAPKEYYIGLRHSINKNTGINYRKAVENFINEYDAVSYEFVKFVNMLLKSNPNVLGMLWLKPEHYLHIDELIKPLLDNRDLFSSKLAFHSFVGYANDQLKKMEKFDRQGYMGKKRKELIEKYKFDVKNSAHCIRLLQTAIDFLNTGELKVFRDNDAEKFLSIKRGEWSLEQVKKEADRLFSLSHEAKANSSLTNEPNYVKVEEIVIDIMNNYLKTS